MCKEKQKVAIERRTEKVVASLRGKIVKVVKERAKAVVTLPKRKREMKIAMMSMNKVKKWLNFDDKYWAKIVGLQGLMKIHWGKIQKDLV